VNRINLLPDGVVARQRRRRDVRAAAVAAAVSLVVAVTWTTVAVRQLKDVAARTVAAQARLNHERDRAGKLDAVAGQATALRTLLAHEGRLKQPVALHGALALLTNLLPESVALTRLTLEAPTAEVVERKQSSKGPPPVPMTRLALEGLAVNDLELAQVVSELAAQKPFANVKLVRSRPVTTAGVTRYAFEISVDVPPAASAEGPGVAQLGRADHGS
jgi:hypothetical protein